uniref:Protein shuttle craft n=1 Tax=Sipha flava TaxID=143950 RepID=A0A2S2Q426_9HEMI
MEIQPVPFSENSSVSNNSGNSSNSNTIETTTDHSIPDASNESQRDLLTNLLNECKVDCVICYERAKNVEQIWNCRNCFQIMHLKCIMVWFIKSQSNGTWRCPACQSEVTGKPDYLCFCGAFKNPYSNNIDVPHSCGQMCGLQKKNANVEYNNCHHKCTLLCHPGPCPQCVVQVLRRCRCEKTEVYVQCGQSTPILCQNICSKQLNCKNHVCEKRCHVGNCEPCKKNCPRSIELMENNATLEDISPGVMYNSQFITPIEQMVSEEELRMLGLNPEELLQTFDNSSSSLDTYDDFLGSEFNDDDDDDDYDDDFDFERIDVDDDNDTDSRFIFNRNHFERAFLPQVTVLNINNSLDRISRQLPALITNADVHSEHSEHSDFISSTSEDDSYPRIPEEDSSMHSDSSAVNVPSVDSISTMDSEESCFHCISYSGSNDNSISSFSPADVRSSYSSSPNSLSESEDSNSHSVSDSSSSY